MTDPCTERPSLFSELNLLVADRSWLRASRANLISRQKPQIGLRLLSPSAPGPGPGGVEQIQLMHGPTHFGPAQP